MTKYKNLSVDEIEDIDLELDEVKEIEFEEFDKDNYETASEDMLEKIRALPVGEDKSRAIRDLKEMQDISCNRQKAKNEKKKIKMEDRRARKELEIKNRNLEKELELKTIQMEHEMEIREEELKTQKRNGILGIVGRLFEVGFMFFGYNYLLNKQNRFESEDSYSTAGSRGLVNNISHFGNIGRK